MARTPPRQFVALALIAAACIVPWRLGYFPHAGGIVYDAVLVSNVAQPVFLRLPTWILVAVAFACHVHLFLAARQGTGAFSRFHARLLTTGTVALLLAIVTAPLLWAGSFAKFLHQRTVTCADGGGCGGLETWVGPGWFFAWIILPLVAILQRGAFDETPGTERKPTATDGSNVP